MYCPLLIPVINNCAQVPILATKIGINIKVWLVIYHVFAQRVFFFFYSGGGEAKLVSEWKLTTLGLMVLMNPTPWCTWSGWGRGTSSPKLLGLEGV